jgi:hypothetical protein
MHETHEKMNLYSTVYAGQNIPVKCMKVPIKHISCEISQKKDMTLSDIDKILIDYKNLKEKLDDKDTLFKNIFIEKVTKSDESVRSLVCASGTCRCITVTVLYPLRTTDI